jgi:transposase
LSTLTTIEVKNLDHLGIIAGLIDEIGIVETINEKLGIDKREKISSGQVVKAMILNGLGFVSKPLYLFSKFFEDKDMEKVLGGSVKSDYLNDDKLGRVMDELYKYGLTQLFLELAIALTKTFKIEVNFNHADMTSFHLHGKYNYNYEESVNPSEGLIKERPIIITQGYSRDHRPDLKQCVLSLITTSDGDLPLLMRVEDGNESDKAVLGHLLKAFKKQVDWSSIVVGDSSLYTQENIQIMKGLKWITRVPMTIKRAKQLVQTVEIEEREKTGEATDSSLKLENYNWKEEIIVYGGIKQRWLIVESQSRKISDLNKLDKQIKKEEEKVAKIIKQLEKEEFECPSQAKYKLKEINRKLKLFKLFQVQLNKKIIKSGQTVYKIKARSEKQDQEITAREKQAGRFILATNVLEQNLLNSVEILLNYKNQQSCERGFRFLKDPVFFADSLFVENPQRVETMLFIMTLCLLVYNLGQREIRKNLQRAKVGIKNQVGKLTDRPTLRWIFQCFQGIHAVVIDGVKQIVNLTDERQFILNLLPSSCQKYYL